MKKIYLNLTLIGALGITFAGCGQPQTFAQKMYGKSAEESATLVLKEAKFPVTYKNGTTLENVEMDNTDKTMVVWTYRTVLIPKAGSENFYLDQNKSLEDQNSKKNIATNCEQLYSYYQNGAKWKTIMQWKTGKVYQEYIVSKEVCDSL